MSKKLINSYTQNQELFPSPLQNGGRVLVEIPQKDYHNIIKHIEMKHGKGIADMAHEHIMNGRNGMVMLRALAVPKEHGGAIFAPGGGGSINPPGYT